ncbi:unnamed protein product [Adineta ricciae]|uniref:Uncharacterized protein n=2 Tax=Adineta ricciae TaxID=249248 RepID=A0A814FHJ5_ADIRI|nr:unnamed protein product [Adineta ricciae]
MKQNTSSSTSFDRPKILLFRFLAHQIHPFAYAVNTFLQPALEDCRTLLHNNPEDTFNILLSLTQTFIRFAPDSELIYDDIQQFAKKLKDSIDDCLTWIDPDTIQQSSQTLESIHRSLLAIIQQQNNDNTSYTNMYKNMSAVLTNLQKINSLPVEVHALSSNGDLDVTIPIEKVDKQDIIPNIYGNLDSRKLNGHTNGYHSTISKEAAASFNIPPPPSSIAESQSIPNSSVALAATSITTKLMNQMKNLTVTSASLPKDTNVTPSIAPRPVSTISSSNEYEITETIVQSTKKPAAAVAAFPPHPFSTVGAEDIDPNTVISQHECSSSKTNAINQGNNYFCHERNLATPTSLCEGTIQFGNTLKLYGTSSVPTMDNDNWNLEKGREYYLDPYFTDRDTADACWHPIKYNLSTIAEQSHLNHTTAIVNSHVTDEFIQEYATKPNRHILRGDLCMTYGTPQSGPQATCLPIGVGLSYDELTLLSCDVHRNSQSVRLFDVRTGQLKHTISSNQQMKLHRPSAVMSNARDNIFIVEREHIYVTEPDGRLIQTISHPSIKQLYGIALFRDRYLLTIESKATDNKTAENSRLLLFDPDSRQLVFEQRIVINKESEEILKQQNISHIQGKILPDATSKPRFLAVHNDNIYIADLGRSLIYGTTIRNQFEFFCTTVFGGQGRGNGQLIDPSGLFVDSGGNIISADSKNDRIQVFSSKGEYKTTLKLNEHIKRPSGICTNRAGTQFYVSCYLAGCVRAFNINY